MTTPSPPPSPPPPPPPPVDPELAAARAAAAEFAAPPLTRETLPLIREARGATVPTDAELDPEGVFEFEERQVPGPRGAPDVGLLVARPKGLAAHRPVVYYLHGGGMVLGSNRTTLDFPLECARDLGLVLVSADYRLAPEHPHPAPVEDAYAGLLWTAAHAAEIGGDPERIVVAGGSAGGGIAAALALLTRDRRGPRPLAQLLVCPMLDDRNDTVSAYQMADSGGWDRTANETGWTALLGDRRGTADVSPYAAPARARDLSGLPPAYIDVGSAEVFRDEDVAYADRIWQAGGQAELHVWPGGFHGFDQLAPRAALSRTARAARKEWLRRQLGE